MSEPSLTATLAHFCAALEPEGLGPPVVRQVGRLLLDFLGVAARGSQSPSTASLARAMEALDAGGGTQPLIASDRTASALAAALAHGTAAHSLELDDLHNASSTHPGVVVFPAAIAAAQLVQASPGAFTAAVVVGYEVATRVGAAVNPATHYARGFHPTATCGAFGAAAAAGRLFGLTAEGLAQAWGICGSAAAGSMAFLSGGAWTKHFQVGLAAKNGLQAAMLAREGFRAPRAIFGDPLGFLTAYAVEPKPARLTEALGERWAVQEVSLKPHACCRYMQPAIDGLIALADEYDLSPEDVAAVTVHCLPAGFRIIAEPAEQKANPEQTTEAQFSMPYGAAVALARRRAGLEEFSDEALGDPTVRALMPKVRCLRDEELGKAWPERWPAVVVVETTDGRQLTRRVDDPKGDPTNPLSDAELVEKFIRLTAPCCTADQREGLIEAALGLGKLASLEPLWALLPARG